MQQVFDTRGEDYAAVNDLTEFNASKLEADIPDQHFTVLDKKESVRARCSIWWREAAQVEGFRTGTIGHYAAADDASGDLLIETACRELRARGCTLAVGPMDGNTWRPYRFVTERGSEKPFLFEPDNPSAWPDQFKRLHFKPLAKYVSETNPSMAKRQPELGNLREKLAAQGVSIAPFDIDCTDADLHGIHAVAREAFRDAFMYSPLDFASFREIYAPLLRQIDPRLILIARQGGKVVGFIFAPPDVMQRSYRSEINAIVIKTVAVLPQKELSGLGRVLIVDLMQNAVAMGYTTAISALMHTENRSQKISRKCAIPMRGYTLFARALNS